MRASDIGSIQTEIEGRWVAMLPLNEKKEYRLLIDRVLDALAVFRCDAVAVKFAEHNTKGGEP